MDVSRINKAGLTHIHFAFATVTTDFKVSVSDVQDQFTKFTKMTGVKKILSFGGWAFSTSPSTFQLFRDATKPANRAKFAISTVEFLKANGLDGLDFDWEYPGAPDIPDIPAGTAEEGANYLAFLKLVRTILPSTASLSIALPASYWYLKQYPVAEIQKYVNYFIYMTYDYHGQWGKFMQPFFRPYPIKYLLSMSQHSLQLTLI
jgi:chitinase